MDSDKWPNLALRASTSRRSWTMVSASLRSASCACFTSVSKASCKDSWAPRLSSIWMSSELRPPSACFSRTSASRIWPTSFACSPCNSSSLRWVSFFRSSSRPPSSSCTCSPSACTSSLCPSCPRCTSASSCCRATTCSFNQSASLTLRASFCLWSSNLSCPRMKDWKARSVSEVRRETSPRSCNMFTWRRFRPSQTSFNLSMRSMCASTFWCL
mmetsp:Transcript_57526/g.186892  ORF Transcript_57526/g.186892 Transcript_57526/m.186892 type:complete len:214 (-) Transcript_57526:604-1245(-)